MRGVTAGASTLNFDAPLRLNFQTSAYVYMFRKIMAYFDVAQCPVISGFFDHVNDDQANI
jgi:hypothetical protein